MNRVKLFLENLIVYGLGNTISKLIPLIMLPIVTRLMPDTYYFGLNDVFNVIVNFSSAIALMGLYDATFRLFFEKKDTEYQKSLCSTAVFFCLITSLILSVALVAGADFWTQVFFSDPNAKILIYLAAMSIIIGASNNLVAAPVRMQNKKTIYIVLHTLSSVLSYSISIPLLLNGHYLIALPLSGVLSSLFIELIFGVLNRKWFSIKTIDVKLLKELLKIGIPLMPSFLVYWLFNSADKLMIAKLLGNNIVGIYSIGSRVAQISQMVYMAFASGWQYFAFSTMKDEDQVQLTSRIFEYMLAISLVVGGGICLVNSFIFNVIFTGDYSQGAIVTPYLFMAPLVQMLFQIATTQFTIMKKTWPTILILTVGACINVVFNYVGINLIGMEGAAIATLIGYVVSVIIAILVLMKKHLIILRYRCFITLGVYLFYLILWRFCNGQRLVMIVFGIVNIFIYYLLYSSEIKLMFSKLRASSQKQ